MALHIIEPDRKTFYGQFSSDLAPVVTIESEETVRYRTIDIGWVLETPIAPDQPQHKCGPCVPEQGRGLSSITSISSMCISAGSSSQLPIASFRSISFSF